MSGTPASQALSRDDEERLSKACAAELFDSGMLDELEPGTWAALSAIHRQLFCDVFSFAGELRDVDLSKGSMRFASRLYLSASVAAVERMPQTDFDEAVAKYVEMNVRHLFREGNGRAMRIWLDHLLAHGTGKAVDWAVVETGEYLRAMERSLVCDTEIKAVLSRALVDVGDAARERFMHGIDASYAYEGFDAYDVHSLADSTQRRD